MAIFIIATCFRHLIRLDSSCWLWITVPRRLSFSGSQTHVVVS